MFMAAKLRNLFPTEPDNSPAVIIQNRTAQAGPGSIKAVEEGWRFFFQCIGLPRIVSCHTGEGATLALALR